MKKLFFCLGISLLMASCTSVIKTARTAETPVSLLSATVADLDVAPERITYTMHPGSELQRVGLANVKRAVEAEALTKNGNADVLVNAEYVITSKNYVFFKRIESITVTGRPAKYKKFHSLSDDVWCNPVFRGTYKDATTSNNSFLNKVLGK